MKTKQTPGSIRIIYWITNVTFWIYLLVALFGVLLGLGFISGLVGDPQLQIGLPLAMELKETGQLLLNGENLNVEMKQLYGRVHIIDTPRAIAQVYGVFMIMMALVFLYIFQTFRDFIKAFYLGKYFDRKNIMLLKRIAYAIVFIWVFYVFYILFQYFYLVRNMSFTTAKFTGDFETYPQILLVALFIWVLSHVFQKGVDLQNENELTI
jgi:hypothetical protein